MNRKDQAEIEKSWQMPKSREEIEEERYYEQMRYENQEYWNMKISLEDDWWNDPEYR